MQDDELAAPNDDGWLALDGRVGQFTEFAFGLADGAGFHTGLVLVCYWAGVNPGLSSERNVLSHRGSRGSFAELCVKVATMPEDCFLDERLAS